MLTRRQVAARLGKSIATVRRLEGVHLRPSRDAAGVHRFESTEVEALALAIAQRRVVRGGAPDASGWKGWLTHGARRNRAKRIAPAAAADRRSSSMNPSVGRLEAEHAALQRCTRTLAELLLDLTTPSQRRRLGNDVLETLRELAGR